MTTPVDPAAEESVRTLLHDLGNSLTLISVLGACLDDLVEPAGVSVVESLERAAEEAAAALEALRRILGAADPNPD
jgi:hypothetical protein